MDEVVPQFLETAHKNSHSTYVFRGVKIAAEVGVVTFSTPNTTHKSQAHSEHNQPEVQETHVTITTEHTQTIYSRPQIFWAPVFEILHIKHKISSLGVILFDGHKVKQVWKSNNKSMNRLLNIKHHAVCLQDTCQQVDTFVNNALCLIQLCFAFLCFVTCASHCMVNL